MPSAPEWLRDKFPDGDREALDVLKDNFVVTRGGRIFGRRGHKTTDREWEAVLYLVHEWDFDYSGKRHFGDQHPA